MATRVVAEVQEMKTKTRGDGEHPRAIPACLVAGLAFFAPSGAGAQQEQLSDPGFDPAVANPAYRLGSGPRVLFDEAHFNFHTAGGRYKALADLLTRDGYRVSPSHERF